jgi:hypothetical protein
LHNISNSLAQSYRGSFSASWYGRPVIDLTLTEIGLEKSRAADKSYAAGHNAPD